MKKASKILFLIGGILTILAAIAFVVIGSVSLVAVGLAESPDVPQWVVDLVTKIAADNKISTKEAVETLAAVGIVFIVLFACSIPAAVLSFICSGKERRPLPLLIVTTAFSLCAGSALCVVGGVLGIVSWATVERKERAPQA